MSLEPGAAPAESVVRMRAHYAEVDRMGFLHHSNHVRWFERGREEFCRRRGAVYRELEDAGVLVVVASLEVAYRSPLRYEELADLTVTLRAVGHASLVFEYALHRVQDRALAATGRSRHAFVTREGRVTRVAGDIARRLSGPELETRLGELG